MPSKLPRPKAEASTSFTDWLETSLDKAEAANPNPGRADGPWPAEIGRRLPSDAIRDLLALDTKPGLSLPVDDFGVWIRRNIADRAVHLTPRCLSRYMSVAQGKSSALAVGDPKTKPAEEQYLPLRDPPSNFRRNAPVRGMISAPTCLWTLGVASLVQHSSRWTADASLRVSTRPATRPASRRPAIEMRLPVKAGLHNIGVTFLREWPKVERELLAEARGASAGRSVPPPNHFPRRDRTCGSTARKSKRLPGAQRRARPGGCRPRS